MSDSFQPGEILRRHLRGAIEVTEARRARFGPGLAAQDEIVTTNRLILVLKGRLNYRMEDRAFRFEAGTQFFVPAWTRRVSRVASREVCEAIWCAFDLDDAGPGIALLCHRKLQGEALKFERERHAALVTLRRNTAAPLRDLRLEAELKAMLGRFWAEAAPPRSLHGSHPPETRIHPQVKDALRWLAEHFREPDALQALYRQAEISPNYLRRHFQQAMSCHPGSYLQRLRLREARHLLEKTATPQKQVAGLVGYDDPQYFSRLYRRFWRKPPGTARKL